jgi:hypothetical protein
VVRYREIFFGMLNLALSMVFYSVLEHQGAERQREHQGERQHRPLRRVALQRLPGETHRRSMVFYSVLEKFYSLTHGTDGIRLPPVRFAGQALEISR